MNGGGDGALWLYGSQARGDADESSDTDLVWVTNAGERPLGALLPPGVQPVSVSTYRWDEIEGMAAYGSLFLRHLATEGRMLLEQPCVAGRLRGVLDGIGPYLRAGVDTDAFLETWSDVQASLAEDGAIYFELATLGTVYRHASILACYLEGRPTFGRLSAVHRMVELWGLDRSRLPSFIELYGFRLFADGRRQRPPVPDRGRVDRWLAEVRDILDHLGERTRR